MGKIKTHLMFPTALHIFNHKMEQEEQQLMIDYIKGTRNKETIDVSGLSKHTKNNLHKIPEFASLRNSINYLQSCSSDLSPQSLSPSHR